MAIRILSAGDDHNPLSLRWLKSFLCRELRISYVMGHLIDVARAVAATLRREKAWMNFYQGIRTAYKIDKENFYNMDEIGINLGICHNTKVLVQSGKKKKYEKELFKLTITLAVILGFQVNLDKSIRIKSPAIFFAL